MPHIDYFFSTLSPFTYLAGNRLEEIADRHGAMITYKPMDIMALFPRIGGLMPAERHSSRRDYSRQDLARRARRAGLPVNLSPAHFPTNAAPSSYAVIAAAGTGGDVGPLVQAFLRAVWVEERDIASDEVVRDCLARAGFDPTLADSGLLAGAETYAANLEEAVSRGVFGSPFYITDTDERFWGHDRLDDLEAHLAGDI
ncbi:MAG: 2-hydroxychromene-2-carboxylate isomerase [Tropicimonas sp.]|uniref:2-hydroxychromene-2-carboxylate isomerase n=1 Tax=Tropicimonas sp. TaxID=2067044 RepID=UPI003A86A687